MSSNTNHSYVNHAAVFVPVFTYIFKDVEEVSRQVFTINKLQFYNGEKVYILGGPKKIC